MAIGDLVGVLLLLWFACDVGVVLGSARLVFLPCILANLPPLTVRRFTLVLVPFLVGVDSSAALSPPSAPPSALGLSGTELSNGDLISILSW